MKYDLARMLREIAQDEKRRKPRPQKQLTQAQIRELVERKRKKSP